MAINAWDDNGIAYKPPCEVPFPENWTIQNLTSEHHGYEDWKTYAIRAGNNVHLATVGHVDRFFSSRGKEIVTLMAAAPNLLKALEHMVRYHDQLSPADIQNAKDAIAKATTVQ